MARSLGQHDLERSALSFLAKAQAALGHSGAYRVVLDLRESPSRRGLNR